MKGKILEVKHIERRYHSDVYRVEWQGKILFHELIDYLDSGNYGGVVNYKTADEEKDIYVGTVTVYTD